MFRFIILNLIIGFCYTASVNPRTTDRYHIKDAPQDPIVYVNNGNYNLDSITTKTTVRPIFNNDQIDTDNLYIEDEDLKNVEKDIELEKSKLAKYSFNAAVLDSINDHSHVRNEERDGTKVRGMYSYSDGFYYRTVHYVADENGYRVIKEDVKKIGDGPKFNPSGRADVSGSLLDKSYSIVIDNDKSPHYTEYSNRKV